MYIERKAESLNGPARIGRVTFSKTGRTLEYRSQRFRKSESGYKWNHFDVDPGQAARRQDLIGGGLRLSGSASIEAPRGDLSRPACDHVKHR
jgi:hypothetical protein